jgi:hypothetical protein
MVKHKQRQALFDLLRQERPSEAPAEATVKPVAPVRPAPAPVAAPAAAPAAASSALKRPANLGPMTQVVTPRSVMPMNQVTLTYGHMAFIGVGVVCLCIISFFAGWHFAGPSGPSEPPLPKVDPGKSFKEVQSGPTAPGVVQPPTTPTKNVTPVPPTKGVRPGEGAYPGGAVGPVPGGSEVVAVAPEETPTPPVVETGAPATGGQYRVQILQSSNDKLVDPVRDYLAQHGIETVLERKSGQFILFSKQHQADDAKAKAYAAQINKQLEAFTRETRIPTSHDAFTVKLK